MNHAQRNPAAPRAARPVADMDSPSARSGSREFEYTAADFERIRSLIYQRAGIALSPKKEDMVYSRLARRLRTYGIRRFCDYLDRLEASGEAEWEVFVNALTTNLTSFFREAHHFDMLKEQLNRIGRERRVNIWCSAASTGEEPYSLAMTAVEAYGTWTPPVSIIASDLDTNVLRHAATGIYAAERVEKLSSEQVRRFFLKGTGSQEGFVRVRPELQKLLSFTRINLLEPNWPVKGELDALFCRNVMIYFDAATQRRVLERMHRAMKPGALLFAGHAENFGNATDLFRLRGKTLYERV